MTPITPSDIRFHGGQTAEDAVKTVQSEFKRYCEESERRIESAKTALETYRTTLPAKLAAIPLAAECAAALANAGFKVTDWPSFIIMHYDVAVADLPKVRHALGHPLQLHLKEPGETDDTLRVILCCTKYPMLRVRYTRPIQEGSRCKVVVTVKTERALVCSI